MSDEPKFVSLAQTRGVQKIVRRMVEIQQLIPALLEVELAKLQAIQKVLEAEGLEELARRGKL